MQATKESKVTIVMSLNEAKDLAYCVARMLSGGDYIDVLPDKERTRNTLDDISALLHPLI